MSSVCLSRLPIVTLCIAGFGIAPLICADDNVQRAARSRRVLEILQSKCFVCHGEDADDLRGGLNILSREGLLKGGESGGPAIVPGSPDASLLYQAVRQTKLAMPPKENNRLSAEEIRDIREWIASGAPWPEESQLAESSTQTNPWSDANGVFVSTSGGLSADWTISERG